MKLIILIVLVLVMLAGCRETTALVEQEDLDAIGTLIRTGKLQYAQDPSTSQCFAYGYVERGTGQGGTWVPCDSLPVEAPPKVPR